MQNRHNQKLKNIGENLIIASPAFAGSAAQITVSQSFCLVCPKAFPRFSKVLHGCFQVVPASAHAGSSIVPITRRLESPACCGAGDPNQTAKVLS